MPMSDLIVGLQEDLAGEYQSVVQYLQHAYLAAGIERSRFSTLLRQHALVEMRHADRLAKTISALGGSPAPTAPAQDSPGSLRDALALDVSRETEQVERYRQRIEQIDDDPALKSIIEDILAEEEDHLASLRAYFAELEPANPQTRQHLIAVA